MVGSLHAMTCRTNPATAVHLCVTCSCFLMTRADLNSCTETVWPAEPKIFTTWTSEDKVCWPQVYTNLGGSFGIHFLKSLNILGLHKTNTNGNKACSQLIK